MVKHAFISAHKMNYSIRPMCQVLGVSNSWFHARPKTQACRQEKADQALNLVAEIRRAIRENKNCYGPLRVFHKLVQEGIECSSYIIRKLMKLHNIRQPKRERWLPKTTESNHNHRIAPNLLDRRFEVCEPNKVWLADITDLFRESRTSKKAPRDKTP